MTKAEFLAVLECFVMYCEDKNKEQKREEETSPAFLDDGEIPF